MVFEIDCIISEDGLRDEVREADADRDFEILVHIDSIVEMFIVWIEERDLSLSLIVTLGNAQT
jgi:hypothetical protein